MARLHFWFSVSYLCVGVGWIGVSVVCSVDSATDVTLFSSRHGVGAGCT